jgi:dTDP-4-amino-4,6-dideoxygalactose transaminase
MFTKLPPAGNPIRWGISKSFEYKLETYFKGYRLVYYSSGAHALAAAISAIVYEKYIKRPEVLLPAYACPELISAILFAGANPVLVDFEPQRPWLNLEDLTAKLNKNTVALIAVSLFGIPERIQQLKDITGPARITLIEDSAQQFPVTDYEHTWGGDFTVLSFGRGKPVSVLGGGAVLCGKQRYHPLLQELASNPPSQNAIDKILYRFKVMAYNLFLKPGLYFIPSALPWLKLGETRFKKLSTINPMPLIQQSLLPAQLEQ